MSSQSIEVQLALMVQEMKGINEKVASMDKKFDNLNSEYAKKLEVKPVEERLHNVEANIRWIVRTFLAAVVASLVGLFFVFRDKG